MPQTWKKDGRVWAKGHNRMPYLSNYTCSITWGNNLTLHRIAVHINSSIWNATISVPHLSRLQVTDHQLLFRSVGPSLVCPPVYCQTTCLSNARTVRRTTCRSIMQHIHHSVQLTASPTVCLYAHLSVGHPESERQRRQEEGVGMRGKWKGGATISRRYQLKSVCKRGHHTKRNVGKLSVAQSPRPGTST